MDKRMTLIVLLLIGMLLSASYAPQPVFAGDAGETSQKEGTPAHYFVFKYNADGTILPESYQPVRMASPMQSLSDEQVTQALNQPERNFQQLVVLLQAEDGSTVFRDVVTYSPWLRGEFHGSTPGQEIDGHLIPLESTAFVVRLPRLEAARLILQDSQLTTLAEFDLVEMIATTPRIQAEAGSLTEVSKVMSGLPENRVDLVVLGDGYTAAQEAQFYTDANAMLQTFFSISPLAEYENYYNLYMVATASNQSGSDHPPYSSSCGYYDPTCCGDPAMLSDPKQGQMPDTAFDSRFCAYWIHRLLVADDSQVYAAAGAAVPDWDQILLIVNDTTYGGSGGTKLAVVSMHSQAVQIAQHEYGHSFANLADEYTSAYPGYPPCSDVPGSPSPCESNVTDITVREQIKWYPWILDDTLIPTPNNPIYQGLVGLFEGARYQTTGMYRSGYNCIMRALGQPFCQVPSQSYVLTLYEGGWGVPADGISLIEPGSTLPVSTTIDLTHPATQVFSADLLTPVGGPSLSVTWLVDGMPITGVVTNTFTYTTSADSLGVHEIRLHVEDVTSLVNPVMAEDALMQDHIWLVDVIVPVTVSANPMAIFADGVSTSTITASVMTGDGLPMEGVTVTFTTSLGSISPITDTTDASGIANTTLTSAVVSGTATVVAAVSSSSDSVEVEFVDPNSPEVSVSANPTAIFADGVSTSTITAEVTGGGIPKQGVVVTFTTTLGDISPITATTDASGIATATLTSGVISGTATVVAAIDSASDSVEVVFVDPNTPLSVAVSADPTVIFADGVSSSTITAFVGCGGIPEQGVVVTFTTTLGDISPLTATTDASGIAVAMLTSGEVSGIATVTASIDSDSNTVDVEFLALPRTYLPLILKR